MATETLNYAVTITANIFKVAFAAPSTLVAVFPAQQTVIKTHPTDLDLFYFGTSGNIVTLSTALCTNLTNTTRAILIDAILMLAVTVGSSNVNVVNTPNVVINANLGETYTLAATRSSSGTAFTLRPNGTTIRLEQISGNTSTALSAGTNITVRSGITVTGGTWATPATITGSKVEQNTGGTITGGSDTLIHQFGTQLVIDLTNYNLQYTTLQPIQVIINQSGLGSTTGSLMWTELP